jgi:hypothetical protein
VAFCFFSAIFITSSQLSVAVVFLSILALDN